MGYSYILTNDNGNLIGNWFNRRFEAIELSGLYFYSLETTSDYYASLEDDEPFISITQGG